MGVKIYQQKKTGDWYVWVAHKGKRTSRKIGPDKRTAQKAATEYRKKLALGEVDFTNGRGLRTDNRIGTASVYKFSTWFARCRGVQLRRGITRCRFRIRQVGDCRNDARYKT